MSTLQQALIKRTTCAIFDADAILNKHDFSLGKLSNVVELLKKLKSEGIDFAVVSSKGAEITEQIEIAGLNEFFTKKNTFHKDRLDLSVVKQYADECGICNCMIQYGMNKYHMHAAAELGYRPEQCVTVEYNKFATFASYSIGMGTCLFTGMLIESNRRKKLAIVHSITKATEAA